MFLEAGSVADKSRIELAIPGQIVFTVVLIFFVVIVRVVRSVIKTLRAAITV